MSHPHQHGDVTTISCQMCLSDIPPSASGNSEVEDYVMYFCGIECYALWKDDRPEIAQPVITATPG